MKEKIKNKIKNALLRLSAHLNKKIEYYSTRQKKLLLVLFASLFSVVSLSIVLQTFSSADGPVNPVYFPHAHLPAHIGKTNGLPLISDPESELKHIEHIRNFLDSVRVADTLSYNEILQGYPNMVDALSLLQQMLQEQLKKQYGK